MDIVERLRNEPELTSAQYWEAQASMWHENYKEAADEIERLREALRLMPKTIVEAADEIERLRDALRKIVEFYDCLQSQKQEGDYDLLVWIARAALKEGE